MRMSEHEEPPEWLTDEEETGVVSIDRERAKRKLPAGPSSGWESSLVYKERGGAGAKELVLEPTPGNLALLIANEPIWKGCIGYDEFSEREVWLKQPPPVHG